MTFKMQTLLM